MENIVRKGEIACDKQFILFLQCFLSCMTLIFHFKWTLECFSAICFSLDQYKILSYGNELKRVLWKLIVCYTILTINDLEKEGCGRHCGKRGICW